MREVCITPPFQGSKMGVDLPVMCPPHGGAGSSVPWGRAVLEVVVWETPCLVHTGHTEACGSGPRRAWVRWSGIAWVGGVRAQLARPEPSPDAWARKGA